VLARVTDSAVNESRVCGRAAAGGESPRVSGLAMADPDWNEFDFQHVVEIHDPPGGVGKGPREPRAAVSEGPAARVRARARARGLA
jgi:hypothetical protein